MKLFNRYDPDRMNSVVEDFIWIDACMHLMNVGGVIYLMGACYALVHVIARREGKGGSVIHYIADKVWALECRLVARWKGVPCDK